MDVVLVKLGGSLITDKTRERRARPAVIRRLARELCRVSGRIRERVVLGHGSGSFGHVVAARGGLSSGRGGRREPRAVAAVQGAAHELHRRVVSALAAAGAAPFSLPPSAWALAREGRMQRLFADPLVAALEAGLLPVVPGDVVLGPDGSATICSTEAVLLAVARRLGARGHRVRRALWLGVTEGVYDGAGHRVPTLDRGGWRRLRGRVKGAGGTDVTGGMRLRVETALNLARRGVESLVLDGRNPGALEGALRGRRVPGTRVPPAPALGLSS